MTSTQAQTFERAVDEYGYPKFLDWENDPYSNLKRPNPPTAEAVARAQFVDKTYVWEGAAPKAQPK